STWSSVDGRSEENKETAARNAEEHQVRRRHKATSCWLRIGCLDTRPRSGASHLSRSRRGRGFLTNCALAPNPAISLSRRRRPGAVGAPAGLFRVAGSARSPTDAWMPPVLTWLIPRRLELAGCGLDPSAL